MVDETGTIERFDWSENYEKIRKALGADDPVRTPALPPSLPSSFLPFIKRFDWSENYDKIRKVLGSSLPPFPTVCALDEDVVSPL